MASVKERVEALRARHQVVDHVVRMVQHYGSVNGSLQAGAVTYFAFLSFFPVLALAFYAVGKVAKFYSRAQDDLLGAIDNLLPDLVGDGSGQVPVSSLEEAAGGIAIVSLAGVLYAGLGWITAIRDALESVFERPAGEQPSFVVGKLRDLVSLVSIGALLLVSVAVAGLVSALTSLVLQWLGLDSELDWSVTLLARVLGFLANVLLFFVVFRLVARPHAPIRSQWSGAILGAVAFEALKELSFLVLGSTKDQPAFQAFGIALVLLVWINYFSRVILYSAAWVHTSPAARAQRERAALDADHAEMEMKELTEVQLRETPPAAGGPRPRTAFAAGGATMLGLVALLRRRKHDR